MRLNAGIVTDKLKETKFFYRDILKFGITFENDFYLLMHTPNQKDSIGFLLPNHPSQNSAFHKPYNGSGMFLTIEIENVDDLYQDILKKDVKIAFEIKDEDWGDRHFGVIDPNGIAVDFVTYQKPE